MFDWIGTFTLVFLGETIFQSFLLNLKRGERQDSKSFEKKTQLLSNIFDARSTGVTRDARPLAAVIDAATKVFHHPLADDR